MKALDDYFLMEVVFTLLHFFLPIFMFSWTEKNGSERANVNTRHETVMFRLSLGSDWSDVDQKLISFASCEVHLAKFITSEYHGENLSEKFIPVFDGYQTGILKDKSKQDGAVPEARFS